PCINAGKYRRYNPECTEFQNWLASLSAKKENAAHSVEVGPSQQEDQTMARYSYQKGTIRKRKRKQGHIWVLRYRLRFGDKWVEKTEELPCVTKRPEAREAADKRMIEINE